MSLLLSQQVHDTIFKNGTPAPFKDISSLTGVLVWTSQGAAMVTSRFLVDLAVTTIEHNKMEESLQLGTGIFLTYYFMFKALMAETLSETIKDLTISDRTHVKKVCTAKSFNSYQFAINNLESPNSVDPYYFSIALMTPDNDYTLLSIRDRNNMILLQKAKLFAEKYNAVSAQDKFNLINTVDLFFEQEFIPNYPWNLSLDKPALDYTFTPRSTSAFHSKSCKFDDITKSNLEMGLSTNFASFQEYRVFLILPY